VFFHSTVIRINNVEMTPTFFEKQSHFKKWFEKNHLKEKELLVGFYKVGSVKPSITWGQSVDEALCFGWIDGVRRSIDNDSYSIRFTPRKAKSIWSAVNIGKVEEFTKKGLMRPGGLAAFQKREEAKSKIYSYENEPVQLDAKFEKKLKANKMAWTFFQSQPPSYQNPVINWLMTAKQDATKLKRFEELLKDSEAGQKIKRYRYGTKK
jgi:uncharacterized protein YdeI (YjbR/CyaY-like superfamily)